MRDTVVWRCRQSGDAAIMSAGAEEGATCEPSRRAVGGRPNAIYPYNRGGMHDDGMTAACGRIRVDSARWYPERLHLDGEQASVISGRVSIAFCDRPYRSPQVPTILERPSLFTGVCDCLLGHKPVGQLVKTHSLVLQRPQPFD